jgi:hypothetical protein
MPLGGLFSRPEILDDGHHGSEHGQANQYPERWFVVLGKETQDGGTVMKTQEGRDRIADRAAQR